MKKKLLILLTVLVLAFSGSLVACGDGGEKLEKGTYGAAYAPTDVVSISTTRGTAAYEEINADFQTLVYNRNGKAEEMTNAKPLVLSTNDANTVFTFNAELSLSKMNKNFNFIEFYVLPSQYDPNKPLNDSAVGNPDFGGIEVKLTQVDDPTRTLTFRVQTRNDKNYESCAVAGGNGQGLHGKFLGNGNKGQFFQTNYGTQLSIPFEGITDAPKRYAGGFAYEPDERTPYVYPTRNKKAERIRDLDADSDLNGDMPWEGFTSDRVRATLKLTEIAGDAPAKIALLSFNGALFGEGKTDTYAPAVEVDNKYNSAVVGEKGVAFPIPAFNVYDAHDGIIDEMSVKVYKDYGSLTQTEFTVTNGKFTPTSAGVYTIVTTAKDKANNVGACELPVTVTERLLPLKANLAGTIPTQVKMGEKVLCPPATIVGGTTDKGYDLIVTDASGNEVPLDVTRRFLASKQGVYRIRYSVYDYLDNRVNYDYYCLSLVNEESIVEWPELPSVVAKGYKVDIPAFEATDWYSYLSPVDAVVKVQLKKPGEATFTDLNSMSYSSDVLGAHVLKIKVRAHKSEVFVEKDYPFTVVASDYVRDYFTTDNMTMKKEDNVIRFSPDVVNEDCSLAFINPLLASNFDIRFMNAEKGNADYYKAINYVKLVLTDRDDASKTLTIKLTADPSNRYAGWIEYNGVAYKAGQSSFDATKPFAITFKDGYIANLGARIAKITTWDNGETFEGFPSGCLYTKLFVNATSTDASIQLRSLSSHTNFLWDAKDNSRPVLSFKGVFSTTTEIGQVVTIPEVELFDAFSGKVASTTTVEKDGKVIVSNSGKVQFTATEHGVYSVTVVGRDQRGNTLNYTANVYCNNLTKPIISLNAAVPTTGVVGKTITLTNASAVNSVGEAIDTHIVVTRPGGSAIKVVEGEKTSTFVPDRAGRYVVYYQAFDADFNAQWIKFFIQVTEK